MSDLPANAPDIGPQYGGDDPFKKRARLHQSRYRAEILGAGFNGYGSRLVEPAARGLANYYDGLGVREALRRRYPNYSRDRDADMLRSEHIPFNLFAPLMHRPSLTQRVLESAFGINHCGPIEIQIEHAPTPKQDYLDDATSFDAFVRAADEPGHALGIGIEVKYTERGYRVGVKERRAVDDAESPYWRITRQSGAFNGDDHSALVSDDLRQIWRNHLLGLAMRRRGELNEFFSITVAPAGNEHIHRAVEVYRSHLTEEARQRVFACTYEQLIAAIPDDGELTAWKRYLVDRYIVD